MNKRKLVSAADTLVRGSNEHCLVITLSKDRLQCVGDSFWVGKLTWPFLALVIRRKKGMVKGTHQKGGLLV